jgi:hypothetical protein
MGCTMDLTQSSKGKNKKMENLNTYNNEKLQLVNPAYLKIIELLKAGGEKIKKDLRKSRAVRFCPVAQMAREHLEQTMKSVPEAPRVQHIQLLASAIQNVIYQVRATKEDFDSEELMHIREYAENLLKEAWKSIPRQ